MQETTVPDAVQARADRMLASMPTLRLYIVASPDNSRHDIVARRDWDEPHERNRLTPERKLAGWTVVANVPDAA